MKTSTHKSYLDLIYESRNKEYGAYQARSRSSFFLGISFLLSLVLIFGGFILTRKIVRSDSADSSGTTLKVQHRKVVGYSQLSAPPPIETTPTPDLPVGKKRVVKPTQLATRKFLPPVVRRDEEILRGESIPTQAELKKVNPGKQTVAGDSLGAVDLTAYDEAIIELDVDIAVNPLVEKAIVGSPPPEPAPPPPKKEPEPRTKEPEADKVYTVVEVPAQFPGGEPAMFQFIAENLRYPEMARENNIQGIIVLQMTVETDGSISNIEILRDIGGGCAEEAVRMVKLMPKWEPAVQQQIQVRFNVILPIKFQLN